MTKISVESKRIDGFRRDLIYMNMLELLERIQKFDHLKNDSILRSQLNAVTFHAREEINKQNVPDNK